MDRLQRLPNDNLCGYATPLLEAVSEIADLAAWKISSAAAGILSTLELAKRAHNIEASVAAFFDVNRKQPRDADTGFVNLNKRHAEPPIVLAQYYHDGCCCCFRNKTNASSAATVTATCPVHARRQTLANALLARSARIFLHMLVSGPNPRLPEIQANVQDSVQLLQWEENKEIIGQMALSWPLAVLRSMAVGIEDHEVLSSAAALCGGLWTYPDEQGPVEVKQASAFQFIDFQ